MLNGVLTCNLGFGIETIRCKDNRENTSDISLSYVYGNVSAIITSLITHNNLPPLVPPYSFISFRILPQGMAFLVSHIQNPQNADRSPTLIHNILGRYTIVMTSSAGMHLRRSLSGVKDEKNGKVVTLRSNTADMTMREGFSLGRFLSSPVTSATRKQQQRMDRCPMALNRRTASYEPVLDEGNHEDDDDETEQQRRRKAPFFASKTTTSTSSSKQSSKTSSSSTPPRVMKSSSSTAASATTTPSSKQLTSPVPLKNTLSLRRNMSKQVKKEPPIDECYDEYHEDTIDEYEIQHKKKKVPTTTTGTTPTIARRSRIASCLYTIFILSLYGACATIAYFTMTHIMTNTDKNNDKTSAAATTLSMLASYLSYNTNVNTLPCSTEEKCHLQYINLRQNFNTHVQQEQLVIVVDQFLVGNYKTKGCFLKGNNVYFGTGGTYTDMIVELDDMTDDSSSKIRLQCQEDNNNEEYTNPNSSNQNYINNDDDGNDNDIMEELTVPTPRDDDGTFWDVSLEDATTATDDDDYDDDGNGNVPPLVEATVNNIFLDNTTTPSPTTIIATPVPTTPSPTDTIQDTVTVFYVMSDCPYSNNERQVLMPAHIASIPSDAEFLFHLGDLQYAMTDNCEEWAYESASSILKQSSVPTFVLPGDNDMNDCDNQSQGIAMWTKYFMKLDLYWGHSFTITRWGTLEESFSFLYKGVIYFGLNIPGGTPINPVETARLHAEHITMISSIIDGLDESDYSVIVLLGHVDPSYDDAGYSHNFFESFTSIVRQLNKPTIHFHGDWHEYYEVEGGDYKVDKYMRISLDGESIAPPLRVEIDSSRVDGPVRISRMDSSLTVDCCDSGWPRQDEL